MSSPARGLRRRTHSSIRSLFSGRCPACRAARKADRAGAGTSYGGSYSSGGYSTAPQRELFVVTCAHCGREARVPFQPRGDKPVYCSDYFETQRGRASGTRR